MTSTETDHHRGNGHEQRCQTNDELPGKIFTEITLLIPRCEYREEHHQWGNRTAKSNERCDCKGFKFWFVFKSWGAGVVFEVTGDSGGCGKGHCRYQCCYQGARFRGFFQPFSTTLEKLPVSLAEDISRCLVFIVVSTKEMRSHRFLNKLHHIMSDSNQKI